MATPSSGNRPSKPVKLNAAKLLLGTLLSIAVLLSLLALQLSLQLAGSAQNNIGPQFQNNNAAGPSSVVPDELKASVHMTEKELLDNSGKYDKDRVYCMIPFIWNPKIYDVSE
jgi:hypothetical protein